MYFAKCTLHIHHQCTVSCTKMLKTCTAPLPMISAKDSFKSPCLPLQRRLLGKRMQEDGRDLNLPNEHHSLSLTGLIIISGVIILLLFLAITWKP